jgi:hypothetical protein
MEFERHAAPYRDAQSRLLDFEEIYTAHDVDRLADQGEIGRASCRERV